MKQKITEKLQIPEGISCAYADKILTCKKESQELKRKIQIPEVEIKISGSEIILECKKGNKNKYKIIKTNAAHIKNLFRGLTEKFVYELEACNVHFPMTLKIEGDKLAIGNFLGEKTPRYAKILPDVEVDVKGQKITISSANRESAGQTAANFEKATKVKGRDRRIYQDGIFMTEKPRRKK